MADHHPRGGNTHHLVQATVRPLDQDGVRVAEAGTVAFLVATAWLWTRRDALRADGHAWYLHVAVAGVLLGLVGIAWCRRRARRRSGETVRA